MDATGNEQIDAITAGASQLLAGFRERAHILRAILMAVEQSETVRALVASSDAYEEAKTAVMARFRIDEVQARAVLDMQIRRLSRSERQVLAGEYREISTKVVRLESMLVSPDQLRALVGTSEGDLLAKRSIRPKD